MVDEPETNLSEPETSATLGSRLSSGARQVWAHSWIRRILLTILTIAVIVGIIFGIRAIRLHYKSTPPAIPAGAKQSPNASKNTSGQGSSSTPTAKSSTAKSSNSSSNSSTAAGPSLKSGQQLTNTGPGDVVAIFLGVSFAAAGLHYIVSLRRQTS